MFEAGLGISLLNNDTANLRNATGLTNRIEDLKLWELESNNNNQAIAAYKTGKIFGDIGGVITGGSEITGGIGLGAAAGTVEFAGIPVTAGGSVVLMIPTAVAAVGAVDLGIVTTGTSAGNFVNDARDTFNFADGSSGSEGTGNPVFKSEDLLDSHYQKHVVDQGEFGNITKDQYLKNAQDLVTSKPGGDILTKTRTNGDTIFYNKATNEFSVTDKSGSIKTYFKPTNGIDYYNGQK